MFRTMMLVGAAALATPAAAQSMAQPADLQVTPAALTAGMMPTETYTDGSETVMQGAAVAEPISASRLAYDFGGDWGRIGTPDWSVARAPVEVAGYRVNSVTGTIDPVAATGQGGPIDASDWSAISPEGRDLTPLEFGVWVLEQNGKPVADAVEATRRDRAANLLAVQVLNVTSPALGTADANRDMRVSHAELIAYSGA